MMDLVIGSMILPAMNERREAKYRFYQEKLEFGGGCRGPNGERTVPWWMRGVECADKIPMTLWCDGDYHQIEATLRRLARERPTLTAEDHSFFGAHTEGAVEITLEGGRHSGGGGGGGGDSN